MLSVATALSNCKPVKTKPPNILIIYADDLGFGDVSFQNPDSKILTPYLDQLTSEGMRFTDAHSSSGICSPSRFALLTGTYHWRRQHNIVRSFGKPFFNESDITLPQVLRDHGYTTACIGKWHLGWHWEFKNEPSGEIIGVNNVQKVYLPEDIVWDKPIAGGPIDRGFDYYFGDGTINFPPYTWVENDRVLVTPTEMMYTDNVGYEPKVDKWHFRIGPRAKDWNPYEVLPTLTDKGIEWIREQDGDKPFFLYFSLTSPHLPIIPNDEFDGMSEAGAYGDFMVQTDWVCGQLIEALKEKGFEDNTIVIFTSDNGPEQNVFELAREYGHFSMGELRGLKVDIWEGGHRVPMVIKWPGYVEAGSVSSKLISQIDIMSTLAAITDIELPEGAAPDGFNFLPTLLGEPYEIPEREVLIHNTLATKWAVRKGEWLYMNVNSGEHRRMPEFFKELRGYTDFETEGLLFNLNHDIEQRVNLYDQYTEIVMELDHHLEASKEQGYMIKDR